MTADLAGITVVSLEQAVAAPYVSGRLAEAGARVIKIERPEGDFARHYDDLVHGESAYFVWLNRGKESVCLDLRDADDHALLGRMLARADVFIQNLAPGAIARLGFDQAELRQQYPRLITVAISGYGEDGPLKDLKAYDLLVQAESGLSQITGTKEGLTRVGVSVCDIAAGMTAYQSVLQALIARGVTGKGRHLSVSLFHALTDWMNVPYLQYAYGGKQPVRDGLNHPTIAPYGAYNCRDETDVLFSIQNAREWRVFCTDILRLPGLIDDPRFDSNSRRVANRAALDAVLRPIFAKVTRADMAVQLERARIAYGYVSTMDDLANHPQNRFVEVDSPTGPVRMFAPGTLIDGTIPTPGPIPALGQHTNAVRAEFADGRRA